MDFAHHNTNVALPGLPGEFVQQPKTIDSLKRRISKRQLLGVRLYPIGFVLSYSFSDGQPGLGQIHPNHKESLFGKIAGIPPSSTA